MTSNQPTDNPSFNNTCTHLHIAASRGRIGNESLNKKVIYHKPKTEGVIDYLIIFMSSSLITMQKLVTVTVIHTVCSYVGSPKFWRLWGPAPWNKERT